MQTSFVLICSFQSPLCFFCLLISFIAQPNGFDFERFERKALVWLEDGVPSSAVSFKNLIFCFNFHAWLTASDAFVEPHQDVAIWAGVHRRKGDIGLVIVEDSVSFFTSGLVLAQMADWRAVKQGAQLHRLAHFGGRMRLESKGEMVSSLVKGAFLRIHAAICATAAAAQKRDKDILADQLMPWCSSVGDAQTALAVTVIDPVQCRPVP